MCFTYSGFSASVGPMVRQAHHGDGYFLGTVVGSATWLLLVHFAFSDALIASVLVPI